MSILLDKQKQFVADIAKLIIYTQSIGYDLTFGDAYRDPRVFGIVGVRKGYGHYKSCHKLRLAVDFNLFIDGIYQQNSDAYKPLGDYWKSLNTNNRWGGDFSIPDGNHFSVTHDGHS